MGNAQKVFFETGEIEPISCVGNTIIQIGEDIVEATIRKIKK